MTIQEEELSHLKNRPFQPDKLSAPRNFETSSITKKYDRLVLEVGAGKGMHALSFAKGHLDTHIIAIERTRNKFEAFAKLAAVDHLENLSLVHADAIAWIVHGVAPDTVDEIYILYPNPEQHNSNQQWLNMPFFEFLLSRLRVGGKIILATNIEPYIDAAEQQAVVVWRLSTERRLVATDSQRTHFEIKYLARGETCWQLTMIKPESYRTRFDDWSKI